MGDQGGILLFLAFIVVVGVCVNIIYYNKHTPAPADDPPPAPSILSVNTKRLVITVPADDINPTLSTELLNALSYLSIALILELRVTQQLVQVSIDCNDDQIPSVKQAIFSVYHSADISVKNMFIINAQIKYYQQSFFRHDRVHHWPLAQLKDFKQIDPINTIIQAVLPLEKSEQFCMYITIRPLPKLVSDKILLNIHNVGAINDDQKRYDLANDRFYSTPHFGADIRVTFKSLDEESLLRKGKLITSIITSRFKSAEYEGFTATPITIKTGRDFIPYITEDNADNMITTSELAAIWHPLSNKVTASGVRFLKFPATLIPESVTQSTGLALGTHRQRGEDATVRLPLEDLQRGHAILLGKTRVGKTTLGHQMARDIKQLLPDSSLIILDPTGDWVTDYAKRSVTEQRINRTYLLQLGDTEFPPSIPILRPPKGIPIDTFITITSETLRLIFRDQWSSSRMETVLFNTVAALAYNTGSTLLDFEKLYTIPGFRRRILSRVPDEVVRDYWNRFDEMSRTEQQQRTDPILSRVSVFTRSQAIRNIMCRSDAGFDITQLIDESADILVSTVGPDIYDVADILIELLISRINLAVFSRLGNNKDRTPVFLMIDESQHIKGQSLPKMLSEAAKTGLCVVALSQYLDQWTEALSDAILGNVGTEIIFQVGPNDSRKLSNFLSPFTPAEAENLDKFEALVKLRVAGRTIPTFNLNTLPLEGEADEATYNHVLEQSRARFTKPRDQLKPPIPELFEAAFAHEAADVEED